MKRVRGAGMRGRRGTDRKDLVLIEGTAFRYERE